MGIAIDVFAARVAKECVGAANALAELQDHFSENIQGADTDTLIMDIQSLDTAQQTLTDLAELFSALSTTTAMHQFAIPTSVFARMQQATLRERLLGEAGRPVERAIDLF